MMNDMEDQQSSSIKRSPKLEAIDEKRSPKPTTGNVHES